MIQEIEKGRKYKLIVNVGSGKGRKRKTRIVSCNGKKEAKRLYSEFEQEVRDSLNITDGTVKLLLDDYIDSCKDKGIEQTTLRGYKHCVNRIIERIGDRKAADITLYDVNKLIRDLNKTYASKSVRNTVSVLHSSYDRAIRQGQLKDNPCQYCELPQKSKRHQAVVKESELKLLIDAIAAQDLDTQVAMELALWKGLRRSEICGLKPEDVDVDNNTVTVRRTRHVLDGVESIQKTKTLKSARTVAVPQFVSDHIKELLELHESYDWKIDGWLILDVDGRALHPGTLSSRIRRLTEATLSERVTIHGLRHTFASLLIHSQQVDIAQISAELGHSTISTTLNIYTHLIDEATVSSRQISDVISKTATSDATLEK